MKTVQLFSSYIVPLVIFITVVTGVCKKNNIYDIFMIGVNEAVKITFDILPSVIGLMMAIGMINSCGIIDIAVNYLKPVLSFAGIPADILPLALLRPVSGSACLGIIADILKRCGADSYTGRIASVMMGSTETTFYTIALFYGTIKRKVSGRIIVAALVGDLVGVSASIFFTRLFFRI